MRKRTKARECALKILYQMDITKEDSLHCIEDYWRSNEEGDATIIEFADSLVKGVVKKIDKIDNIIKEYATNWNIERMAVVDRNILRLSTYELLFIEEIPPKVSINEAVDIAKKYGDTESGKFVNGILDKISKLEVQSGKKS